MNSTSFDFSETAVLVTGGTSGIGHAVATRFAAAGADVTVTGRGHDPSGYDTDLSRFTYRRMDTTEPASVDALIADLDALDVLVNNAGANLPGGRDEWEPDVFAEAVQLNLNGPMRLTVGCRTLLADSRIDGGGSVVNIVSMSALRAVPYVPGYAAAKGGLLTLTITLARHWAASGIRVNAVAPGVIRTPMTAPMEHIPELVDAEIAHTPLGRLGAAGEVADAVVFLSSSSASFITGATLAVDGGYLTI